MCWAGCARARKVERSPIPSDSTPVRCASTWEHPWRICACRCTWMGACKARCTSPSATCSSCSPFAIAPLSARASTTSSFFSARRELGVPTFFNFLGPLTNPARPAAAAVGCADPRMAPAMAHVLAERGNTALVFRGADGLDRPAGDPLAVAAGPRDPAGVSHQRSCRTHAARRSCSRTAARPATRHARSRATRFLDRSAV